MSTNPLTQPITPTPTVLATILATSLLSGVIGYYLGLGSTLILSRGSPASSPTPSSPLTPTAPTSKSKATISPTSTDCEDEDDSSPSAELNTFSDVTGECKLVLIVRSDLAMTKGKIAAQCSHATLACYKSLQHTNPTLLRRWERTGQAKIALKGNDEEELLLLLAQAQSLGLNARIIHDAGRTQIAAGSATVLGIGPAPKSVIDQITGHLKLL